MRAGPCCCLISIVSIPLLAILISSPSSAEVPVMWDVAGTWVFPGGWNYGAICSGRAEITAPSEEFSVTARVHNFGTAAVTGLAAVLEAATAAGPIAVAPDPRLTIRDGTLLPEDGAALTWTGTGCRTKPNSGSGPSRAIPTPTATAIPTGRSSRR